jgi:MFS family permease
MNSLQAEISRPAVGLARLPFYYGWVNLSVAALAMVGTLPGRTQGLGLITESLLNDLQIDRILFAQINLWATLIGALFCIGVGRLVDRFGSRSILAIVAFALGAVVLLMSGAHGIFAIALLITLTRGFGQSALSVISLTMVGQWFVRRLSLAMGIYSIALSIGFMIAFPVVGEVVKNSGWRVAWSSIGGALLLGLVPLALLLARRTPEACGISADGERSAAQKPTKAQQAEIQALENKPEEAQTGYTLWQSLGTPAFWVFALSSAVYGLIASGIALFNESILAERGFDATTYYQSLVITALTALAGNFLGGWLATKWVMNRLMALAMGLLMASLLALPHVHTFAHIVVYAIVMGIAGGFIIVLFFSFWSAAFGRAHLGKIQGAAQSLTVLASAIGPLLLAECVARTGSYAAMFYVLAFVVGILGVSAWFVTLPSKKEGLAQS